MEDTQQLTTVPNLSELTTNNFFNTKTTEISSSYVILDNKI
jgi:hypothetical protein